MREWLRTHAVPDKDAANALQTRPAAEKNTRTRNRRRNPSAWDFPLPDLSIDLHNHTVDEAIAHIDENLTAMEKSGLQCLRIVHGGGHPGYGPIKRALDRQFRTVWKHRVAFYRTEPDNLGSSLLKLSPAQKSTDKKRRP